MVGPELILQVMEKVQMIRQRMKAAQDRYKSYADKKIQPLEFEIGNHVFLKVSPTKGIVYFGVKGKLNPSKQKSSMSLTSYQSVNSYYMLHQVY